ncbi:hypothetical protein D3C72_1060260 [compost metagenome]
MQVDVYFKQAEVNRYPQRYRYTGFQVDRYLTVGFHNHLHIGIDCNVERGRDNGKINLAVQPAHNPYGSRNFIIRLVFAQCTGIRTVEGNDAFENTNYGNTETGFEDAFINRLAYAQLQAQTEFYNRVKLTQRGFGYIV